MLHNDRQWHITQAGSPEELATQLTEYTWCPSQGFRLGKYLFLNDATCDAGVQEYGVLVQDGERYRQFESLSCCWVTYEGMVDYLQKLLRDEVRELEFGWVEGWRVVGNLGFVAGAAPEKRWN